MSGPVSRRERRVIHIIVPQRVGSIGGADLHVRDLAAEQTRAGIWRPLILSPRAPDHYLRLLHDENLSVVDIPGGPVKLAALPRQHEISLIHAHGYEANYLLAVMRVLARSWRTVPAVVTAHGWIETTRWLQLKSALDRFCGRPAAVAIATAKRHAHRLEISGRTTLIIHNGVAAPDPARLEGLWRDALRRRLGVPADCFLAGTVGRLSPEKRLDLFLQAARAVSRSHPSAHFLIVGGGPERASLERAAGALGILDRVTFTGLVDDVTPIYASLDTMIQPSDTEGSPRTVLEAMAHAVPVIATAVGDVGQLLDGGAAGLLIPRGDAIALRQAILALRVDPARARALGQQGRRRHQRLYTLDHMRRAVEAGYDIATRRPC